MRNFLIGFLIVLIPAITNAEFICKSIGADPRFPQHPTFYRCLNTDDLSKESIDRQEFFK